MRVLKQTFREGFFLRRRLIPQNVGYKPDRGINQGLCGNLSSSQDEIAQRHLLNEVFFNQTLIHTLKTAAQQGPSMTGYALREDAAGVLSASADMTQNST